MDHQFLNQLIIVEDGQVYSRKELLPLAQRRYNPQVIQDSSSSEEDDDIDEEELKEDSHQPTKHESPFEQAKEESKTSEQIEGYNSDNSEIGYLGSSILSAKQANIEDQTAPLLTDDDLEYMLHNNRLKMSMKRNILKKSMSEDLTWADILKSDH